MPIHDGRSIHCGNVSDGRRTRHYWALLYGGKAVGFVVLERKDGAPPLSVERWVTFDTVGEAIRTAQELEEGAGRR